MATVGRNEPCPCGSGKKHKKCCIQKEEHKVVQLKPKTQKSKSSGSFTKKLIKKIENSKQKSKKDSLLCFDDFKTKKEIEEDIDNLYKQIDQEGVDPVCIMYMEIQHRLSYFTELFTELPEFNDYIDIITSAEEEYMPDYPPMSPVTKSHFICWYLFDLRFGREQITMGECFYDVLKEYTNDTPRLHLLKNLNESSLRIYEITDIEKAKGFVSLKDIITNDEHKGYSASGYTGYDIGELWLTRFLPPPIDAVNHGVIFTTPYVLIRRTKQQWIKSLNEYMKKTSISDPIESYRYLMKYGLDNRFWMEVIMNTYFNYQGDAVFLGGLLHENFH